MQNNFYNSELFYHPIWDSRIVFTGIYEALILALNLQQENNTYSFKDSNEKCI